MVGPVRSVFPFNMAAILFFILLVLLHEHIQLALAQAQVNYSVALPLTVRSPYLSGWLPQMNGTANATSHDATSVTASELYQVCYFSESDAARDHDPFVDSRREICVSLSVSTASCTGLLGQLRTHMAKMRQIGTVTSPLRTSRIE